MKAFVITLEGHEYSERVAARCIETARTVGKIEVEKFRAVAPEHAIEVMQQYGLRWTWGPGYGKLKHEGYGGPLENRIGCAMSHYLLWRKCLTEIAEPILILEHDAVFIREMPDAEFYGLTQINDPRGATKRGDWWSDQMTARGKVGLSGKTHVLPRDVPDGLAGNSAYVIVPEAARELISMVSKIGLWPNDALACIQLFPLLYEWFPFITRVEQERSTTSAAA